MAVLPLFDHLLGALNPGVGGGIHPASQRIEDIDVLPYHPFGHPGGAAGIEDVVVVVRARREVPLWTGGGQSVLVGHGARGQWGVRPVLDPDEEPKVGEFGKELGDPGPVLGLMDQRHQVGVGEQVAQLVLDVAVVDVDPDGPQFEDRPCGLHPLHAVQRVDADMVTRPHALVGQIVGQPVGPILHLGVGAALALGHQVLPVTESVNSRLE